MRALSPSNTSAKSSVFVHPAINPPSFSLMTTVYILLSVSLISLVSLTGVFLLSLHKTLLQKMLLNLVGFATGALFANVFLHLLPEIAETSSDIHFSFALVLGGIVLSFIIEKFIHWHHCHNLECHHSEPVGMMMLLGDGAHNITDGILIATTYLVDPTVGMATTIAVIAHEIPQEIGDFAVLLHSGFSRTKALLWNFISALTAFLGAGLVIVLHEHLVGIEEFLLPVVAGNFIYIAGSDLIPALHKHAKSKQAVMQLLSMIAGIALMYTIFSNSDAHGHGEEPHGHEQELYHEDEHDEHE